MQKSLIIDVWPGSKHNSLTMSINKHFIVLNFKEGMITTAPINHWDYFFLISAFNSYALLRFFTFTKHSIQAQILLNFNNYLKTSVNLVITQGLTEELTQNWGHYSTRHKYFYSTRRWRQKIWQWSHDSQSRRQINISFSIGFCVFWKPVSIWTGINWRNFSP